MSVRKQVGFLNFNFLGCFNDKMVSFKSESDTGQLFQLSLPCQNPLVNIFRAEENENIYQDSEWFC